MSFMGVFPEFVGDGLQAVPRIPARHALKGVPYNGGDLAERSRNHFAQHADCVAKLIVAQIRRGTEAQDVAAKIRSHLSGTQSSTQLARARRSDGQKSSSTIRGHRLDARDGR